ncbi:hypothetical protein HanPI659440_Chr07g0262341 [Helianthus annuus]|nr:hypothetical protein HanPI659440_Chr07g0262341 [Helianthus annuus]
MLIYFLLSREFKIVINNGAAYKWRCRITCLRALYLLNPDNSTTCLNLFCYNSLFLFDPARLL